MLHWQFCQNGKASFLIFRDTPWVIILSCSAMTTGIAAKPAMILICAKVQGSRIQPFHSHALGNGHDRDGLPVSL